MLGRSRYLISEKYLKVGDTSIILIIYKYVLFCRKSVNTITNAVSNFLCGFNSSLCRCTMFKSIFGQKQIVLLPLVSTKIRIINLIL